jgi:hypothetical protein
MKKIVPFGWRLVWLGAAIAGCAPLNAAPLPVSNVGASAYSIEGTNNPTLTLVRGVTYVFSVNAPGHPFWIKTARVTGTGSAYATGVSGNGVAVGQLTFAVPTNAPNTLFYDCQFHSAMSGTLNIVDAPSPPLVRIVTLQVGQQVTVQSTAAAGWTPVPEYQCDLTDTNWTAVAAFTNSLANGTNTTTFDRLDPVCGPGVFIRLRQQPN